MFSYYLDLAVRSLKRNVALTILMIVAIAFGVGASMTTLTVLHVLSSDVCSSDLDRLFYVQLEPRSADSRRPGDLEPADQVTRADAENLLRAARADHQAMMTGGAAAIEPDRPGLDPFYADARATSADFFVMFDVPFLAGTGWSAADDTSNARVAVIAKPLAEKLFGTTDVVGRAIRVGGVELRVTGVIDTWRPTPHFYDLNVQDYGKPEQLFLPFSTSREIKISRNGSMNCWGQAEDPEAVGAPCERIQFWVELDSADKVAAYHDYLVHYSEDQKRAGV